MNSIVKPLMKLQKKMALKINLKPGDFAMIDWNGSLYHKV